MNAMLSFACIFLFANYVLCTFSFGVATLICIYALWHCLFIIANKIVTVTEYIILFNVSAYL